MPQGTCPWRSGDQKIGHRASMRPAEVDCGTFRSTFARGRTISSSSTTPVRCGRPRCNAVPRIGRAPLVPVMEADNLWDCYDCREPGLG